MKIGKDTIATLAYTLRYDDARGDIIEIVDENDPMDVLMGHDVMLDVLEKNLQGLVPGDHFELIIGQTEGYGSYDEEKIVTVPQSELLAEVPEGEEVSLKEGSIIPIQDMDGGEFQAVVLKKENGTVTLDFNHPLAGETLHFMGKVLEVRKATPEEIAAETAENIDE
ncbi:MAG: FKBP-type peptidyl-prolyl cis-trans isomerase [Bacteroidales bacterium]|nr:FKBP-type peptidyl-prolyl cis-trans isomerase [Bacteroidales bacterium]MDE7072492.1 FKBP-type peptidyl-prolyl cis-trans isomerase [Bacteroidales bacterium]